MFEDVLESIDALNAENVKNMAHLENVLEFHKIHMSKDDDKYILGEYSACDKVSKDVISWYYRNKKILDQMKEWTDIIKKNYFSINKRFQTLKTG